MVGVLWEGGREIECPIWRGEGGSLGCAMWRICVTIMEQRYSRYSAHTPELFTLVNDKMLFAPRSKTLGISYMPLTFRQRGLCSTSIVVLYELLASTNTHGYSTRFPMNGRGWTELVLRKDAGYVLRNSFIDTFDSLCAFTWTAFATE